MPRSCIFTFNPSFPKIFIKISSNVLLVSKVLGPCRCGLVILDISRACGVTDSIFNRKCHCKHRLLASTCDDKHYAKGIFLPTRELFTTLQFGVRSLYGTCKETARWEAGSDVKAHKNLSMHACQKHVWSSHMPTHLLENNDTIHNPNYRSLYALHHYNLLHITAVSYTHLTLPTNREV